MQHVTLKHQTTLYHIQEDDTPAFVWNFTQARLAVTNVSGQPTGHTFRGHAAQECRPETSITNYQSTLCKIPEVRRSHLHQGENLKSPKRASS